MRKGEWRARVTVGDKGKSQGEGKIQENNEGRERVGVKSTR